MRQITFSLLLSFASLTFCQEVVDWSFLFDKVSPAVVTLVAANATDVVHGSGFLISKDGKIVTNFHAVTDKFTLLARRPDGSFLAITKVLATDKENDLAILQAEGRNLPFVPLGDSDKVRVGEAICVIGSPLVLEGSVSTGVVSAIRELRRGRKVLQITAPISGGSSGSPVFNRKGEVIGIVSFTLSEGQNLKFAVPVNSLKALLRSTEGELFSPRLPTAPLKKEALDPISLLNEALQIAKGIGGGWGQSDALWSVVKGMVKARQFQQALEAAKRIENAWKPVYSWTPPWALCFVAKEMAKAGQFQQALQAAKDIKNVMERIEALCSVAEEMGKAGLKEQAKIVLEQALQVAGGRVWALCSVGEGMSKVGMKEQAKIVLERALQVAETIKDAWWRSRDLCSVGEGMSKVGMKEQAKTVFEQALQAAKSIKDAKQRSEALSSVAQKMAKAGMKEQAKTVFEQALQAAKSIENERKRLGALRFIANEMAEVGQFQQALKVAKSIKDAFLRSDALWRVAEEMVKAGMKEQAKRVFEQALQVAKSIKDAYLRSRAFAEIAIAMLERGKSKERQASQTTTVKTKQSTPPKGKRR